MEVGDLVLWKEEVLAFFLIPVEEVDRITSHIGIIVGEGISEDDREYFEIVWAVSKANKTFVEYIFKDDMDNWFYTIPKTKSVE
jgi:biotin synthase-related radical SAM superfamily protein